MNEQDKKIDKDAKTQDNATAPSAESSRSNMNLYRRIIDWGRNQRQSHPARIAFVESFFLVLLGTMLPTIACSYLFMISGAHGFVLSLGESLKGSDFSFACTGVLTVELLRGKRSKLDSGVRWGSGILLLVISVLTSSGLAMHQFLLNGEVDESLDIISTIVNIVIALSVSVYVASINVTVNEEYDEIYSTD